MKTPTLLPLLWTLLLSTPSRAQDLGLPEPDLKKLADLLPVMYPGPNPKEADEKKAEAAKAEFQKETERIQKALGDKPLLSLSAAWNEIFHRARKPIQNPTGAGSPQELTFKQTAGKPVEIKYAVLLPNGYNPKKRYPLIVCLHDTGDGDKEMSGVKYLAEVWMKAAKEIRDQFIFLCPTTGPGALGKEFRVEFGDRNHVRNIFFPLREVLKNYAVDNDRVYLEGSGRGGEFAYVLAAMKPHQWAAVAVRSALPRTPWVLGNLAAVPLALHYRNGGPVTNNKDAFAAVEAYKTTGSLTLTLQAYDPLPAGQEARAKGSQATDPVHDATSAIAAYFSDKKRNLAPSAVVFSTDSATFPSAHWVRMQKYDVEEGQTAKLTAKIDRASNVIDVATERVEDFRIYLHDDIVDLSKPIKINVNGKLVQEQKFERSLSRFLEYYKENTVDPGLVPAEWIDVHTPPADAPKADGGDTGKD